MTDLDRAGQHPRPAWRHTASMGTMPAISVTSLWVARMRAVESARSDRLFTDRLAGDFAAAAAIDRDPLAGQGPDFFALMAGQVAVRTRFFDDALLRAVGGGRTQVVLLACGMDSRAFRLGWPAGTRVFEVDLPAVFDFKDQVLASRGAEPRCERVPVAADLLGDWPAALARAGFQPGLRTAWLAEGILYAFPPEEADAFIDRVAAMSAPGSTLALDHAEDSALLSQAREGISLQTRDLWEGGPGGDPGEWLTRHGWHPSVRDIGDVAAGYGRPVPGAFDAGRGDTGRGWLVTALIPG